MRIKLLVVLVLLLLAMADVSHAGGRCGRWGGGWGRRWGGGWGGGLGAVVMALVGVDGGWGPSFGVTYVAPVSIAQSMLSSPGACMQRPRMTYSAPALYRAQTRLARLWPSGTHRRRLRSDDQPGHSQLPGRLRSAYNRTPLTAAPAPAWESENESWQESPRRRRCDLPAQQRCVALTASQNPTYWAV